MNYRRLKVNSRKTKKNKSLLAAKSSKSASISALDRYTANIGCVRPGSILPEPVFTMSPPPLVTITSATLANEPEREHTVSGSPPASAAGALGGSFSSPGPQIFAV